MNENLLRHALWAWAIFHHGWEPGENAEGELAAHDLWQRLGGDVWEGPLDELLAVAVSRSKGQDLILGLFEGALRIQRTKPQKAEEDLALILSVRRGNRWHGLGLASSYAEVVSRLVGQTRPVLTRVK